jgi:hypothetical protein
LGSRPGSSEQPVDGGRGVGLGRRSRPSGVGSWIQSWWHTLHGLALDAVGTRRSGRARRGRRDGRHRAGHRRRVSRRQDRLGRRRDRGGRRGDGELIAPVLDRLLDDAREADDTGAGHSKDQQHGEDHSSAPACPPPSANPLQPSKPKCVGVLPDRAGIARALDRSCCHLLPSARPAPVRPGGYAHRG